MQNMVHLILSRHGLPRPDGRPLHQYAIDDATYDGLQLACMAGRLQQQRRNRWIAAGFVLWAAEHFRRAFDGGQFTWVFLFDALNLTEDGALGRELTEAGLSYWQREVWRGSSGHRLQLQSLVVEGGLPNALLAEEGKYRRVVLGLLGDVEVAGVNCPYNVAAIYSGRRARVLPSGFHKEEFFDLLGAFALELANLRAALPDGLPNTATEGWLDRNRPGWREKLSLRVESDAARTLLSDALRTERAARIDNAMFERQLLRAEDGAWNGWLQIPDKAAVDPALLGDLPNDIHAIRLRPDHPLSGHCPDLLLRAEREDDTEVWDVTRASGKRTSLFRFPLAAPVTFQAVAEGRTVARIAPEGSGALDPAEEPSVWLSSDMSSGIEADRLRLVGWGAVRTRAPLAWLLCGAGAEWVLSGELYEREASASRGLRMLWKRCSRRRTQPTGLWLKIFLTGWGRWLTQPFSTKCKHWPRRRAQQYSFYFVRLRRHWRNG